MQSHGETIRKFGHNRRPSYGKAMPVSALLMNYSLPQNRMYDSISRDGISPEDERPPMLFSLSQVNAHHYETHPNTERTPERKMSSDWSVNADNEFVFVSSPDECYPKNTDIEMCPKNDAMTELCNLLCDKSCKKVEKFSTNITSDDVYDKAITVAHVNDKRQQFLSSMIQDSSNFAAESTSLDVSTENKQEIVDSKTLEDSIDKLKISEALVRTSMMTSPAAKRRLVARKIEMEIDAASENAKDSEYVPPRQLLMFLVRYEVLFSLHY